MKFCFKKWHLLFLSLMLVTTSCVEDGPSLLSSSSQDEGPSSLTLSNPGTLYQGGEYTFTGSCAPNGSVVTMLLTNATPSQINNCNCSGGSFTCAATTLSSLPSPDLNIEAQNNKGDSSQVTVATVIPSITLDDPGYFDAGATVTFTGTCSPDDLSVDVTLTTATPSSINGCTCSSGEFSCPPTLLTALSTPKLEIRASNYASSFNIQNMFTARTAYAKAATPPSVYGLNMTMDLILPGPSSLPNNQVLITTSCYSGASCDYGDWDPPGNTVGSFSLLGFSFLTSEIFSDNSPPYLDLKGGTNRTLVIDFGASAASLDTASSKYYFWIAMAGLGASPELVTITSNRSLQVIGYQDAFSTNDFSYLDGSPTSLGSVGTIITTKPASGANGYTYYLIQDRSVSTIELSYVHTNADFHGFILGAIEIRNE